MEEPCPGHVLPFMNMFLKLKNTAYDFFMVYTVDKRLLEFQNNSICIFSFVRSYSTMMLPSMLVGGQFCQNLEWNQKKEIKAYHGLVP